MDGLINPDKSIQLHAVLEGGVGHAYVRCVCVCTRDKLAYRVTRLTCTQKAPSLNLVRNIGYRRIRQPLEADAATVLRSHDNFLPNHYQFTNYPII
jgi:hypothetical protein